MKILITDPVDDALLVRLRKDGFEVDLKPEISPDLLLKLIPDYEGLIVRSGTKVTTEVIEAGRKLRVIGRAGVGVDNIDVDTATRHGIIVMNTPGGNTVSTAEHTLSLLFALARNIPQAHASVVSGKWERKKFVGVELDGKTIGIIGLGKVGREVAKRCLALGMKVVGYDPILSRDVAMKVGVELAGLDEVYARSDFLTVHVPLTPETKGMIGEAEIKQCKPGVRIINCARGGIVDEDALLKGLESGRVAGAALDVFSQEPPGQLKLFFHQKVVATPHLGASTEDALEKISAQIGRQVADALLERGFHGVVNAVALQQGVQEQVRPFVQLAEKLGSLQAQLMRGKLRGITITCSGELLQQSQELLTAAVLRGSFAHLLAEPVNYVNALVIAREMGVVVNERREGESRSFVHLLTLEYETEREKRSISGTVFGPTNLRIVKIDGYQLEAKPEGHLLIYSNVDRPGMLASVGLVLANARINIAGVSLGRIEAGKNALTIMSVDSDIPSAALKEITRVDGVLDSKVVYL
jgi:D-3-phosphoglycerate dehydrogenase